MDDPDKTVFISYRPGISAFVVRAIFRDLQAHGFDVFMDIDTPDGGYFTQSTFNQIAARAHFLVVLTPGALERCKHPSDPVRRGIEFAVQLQRNIVPILVNGFDFSINRGFLVGELALLPTFSGLKVEAEHFEEAMERLRTRFLKQPIAGVMTPPPAAEMATVAQSMARAAAEPAPTQQQLAAEGCFGSGLVKKYAGDHQGAIADYTSAIALNPSFAAAIHNRGLVYLKVGDTARAVADFTRAIELNPELLDARLERASLAYQGGDLETAIGDYEKVLTIQPGYSSVRNNIAECYFAVGIYDKALVNFIAVLEKNEKSTFAMAGAAISYYGLGMHDQALTFLSLYQIHRPGVKDAKSMGEDLHWRPELVAGAEKLLALLKKDKAETPPNL